MRTYISRRSAVSLLGAASLGLGDEADEAHAFPVSEIRAKIEGLYELEEWRVDDSVFQHPQVDGRFVLFNDDIVTNLINNIKESRQTTVVMFGIYELSAGSFVYHYDNASIFTQTESGITVSHRLPWEGMSDFDVTQDGGAVRLESRSSERARFLFDAEKLIYSEGGKLLRVWRRTKVG